MPDKTTPTTAATASGSQSSQRQQPETHNSSSSNSRQSQASGDQSRSSSNNNNNNNNNTNNNNNNNNNTTNNTATSDGSRRTRFTGDVPELPVLLHVDERGARKDQYPQFNRRFITYITSTLDFPEDIMPAILYLLDPVAVLLSKCPTRPKIIIQYRLPEPLDSESQDFLEYTLDEERTLFSKRMAKLGQNMRKVYGFAWGQCSLTLQEEVKTFPDFRAREREQDGLWLLTVLKELCAGIDRRANPYITTYKLCRDYFNLHQQVGESAGAYYRRFKLCIEYLKQLGTDVSVHANLLQNDAFAFFDTTDSSDKFHAAAFILNVEKKYSPMLTQLSNAMLLGRDEYPTTLLKAFSLLSKWETESPPSDNSSSTPPFNN